MSSIAEIVEADVDWFELLPPEQLERVRKVHSAQTSLELQVALLVGGDESAYPIDAILAQLVRLSDFPGFGTILGSAIGVGAISNGRRTGRVQKPRLPLSSRVLNEVHDLLCDQKKYKEERESLIKEYKAGQATFVAGVAASIAPHLSVGAEPLAAAIAVTLTVVGQIGIKAWCAGQTDRRVLQQAELRKRQKEYRAALKELEERKALEQAKAKTETETETEE